MSICAQARGICQVYSPINLFRGLNEYLDETLDIENPLAKRVAKAGIFLGATTAGVLGGLIATIVAIIALPILALKAFYHILREKFASDSTVQEKQRDAVIVTESLIAINLVSLIPIYGPATSITAILSADD